MFALAALIVLLLPALSCRDDLGAPTDTRAPAMVSDLEVSSIADSTVDLTWTQAGDDGMDRTASRVEVRAREGGAIDTEEKWAAALIPAVLPAAPGTPGATASFRFRGLLPERLYGFCVRTFDEAGNAAPLSNSPTATTKAPPPPEAGTIEVHLRAGNGSDHLGTRIVLVDRDSVLVTSAADSVFRFAVLPGSHTLRASRDCSVVGPQAEQTIDVASAVTVTLLWRVNAVGAVTVTSSMRGAAVLVDGEPSGLVTPGVLDCLSPGTHTIGCTLLGAAQPADSVRTIEVSEAPQEVSFALEPKPQARAAVAELFTATLCPNCPFADAALDEVSVNPEFAAGGFLGLQVHASWGGSDPFHVAAGLGGRISYFNASSGLPTTYFNGAHRTSGAGGHPSIEDMVAQYEDSIRVIQSGSDGASRVALHWLSAEKNGSTLQGRIRIILLEDLPAGDSTTVLACSFKDELYSNRTPDGRTAVFNGVVREFKSYGNLNRELGLSRRGDWADVDVSFDLSWDTAWPDTKTGIAVLIHRMKGGPSRIDTAAYRKFP